MNDAQSKTAGSEVLLPCPFCGSTNVFIEPDERGSGGQWVSPIHVGCHSCKCEQCADEKAEAIAAWNRRATLSLSHPATQAGALQAVRSPNDELLVACIKLNGATLTVEPHQLADMFGTDDEQHTYELTFKRMTRAAFEALGEFNGF